MSFKTGICALAGALAAAGTAAAQDYPSPKAEVKAAIEKLAWLQGTWEGEGWHYTHAGKRETYNIKEQIVSKLDGIILAVEGRGWSVDAEGNEIEVHHAVAVMSYDPFAKDYRIHAFTRDGFQTATTPEVGEMSYRWTVPAGPGAEMRYHARIEDGEWVESGERCAGDKCTPAMEMRLRKKTGE